MGGKGELQGLGGKGKVIVSDGTQLRQREAAGNIAIARNVQIVHIADIVHAGREGGGQLCNCTHCALRG